MKIKEDSFIVEDIMLVKVEVFWGEHDDKDLLDGLSKDFVEEIGPFKELLLGKVTLA